MPKNSTAGLHQLIQDEVKAQLKRYAMAKRRDDFINSLVEVLIPALTHHYRATLGIINQRTDQVEKWQHQEEGFLDQFSDRLRLPTRAKGLDITRAVQQALRELFQKDRAGRRVETRKFQKSYNLKTVVPLPENAHEDFLERVQEIVDIFFAD
jgi:TPP-dependent indolepyruvate ferredoxin oxidoreductase alpha subunit